MSQDYPFRLAPLVAKFHLRAAEKEMYEVERRFWRFDELLMDTVSANIA